MGEVTCEEVRPEPGDYIVLHWTDDQGEQSAAGFFDHIEVLGGYWVLDWGMGVREATQDFRFEVVEPPEGQTYIPISEVVFGSDAVPRSPETRDV